MLKFKFLFLVIYSNQSVVKSDKLSYCNNSNFELPYFIMPNYPLNSLHPNQNQSQLTCINITQKNIANSAERTLSSKAFTKTDKLGLCFIIVLVVLILTTIFLVLFYQQKPFPQDEDLAEQTIIDQPYKVGDEVAQTYDLIKLKNSKALCLNGSPGSYYESRTGDLSRILLMFEAGGWCYGDDQSSTLQECLARAKNWIGGSNYRSISFTQQNGIMSRHPNNYFRNWKKIFLAYCDGTGHQGHKKDPVLVNGQTIYFRGYDIKIETFDELQRRFGLFSKAKRVVISGWSAGGLAVLTWANYIYDRVQNGKVFAIPDAGIFYDAQDMNTKKHVFKQRMVNLMKVANVQIDPPTPECLEQHPNEKVNCMFAQNLYKYVKPRMFIVQSLTDTFTLPHILGVSCVNIKNCSEEEKKIVEQSRVNLTSLMKQITSQKKNGAYATSCPLHEILMPSRFTDENFSIPLKSSYTATRAIEQWFRYPKMDNFHLDLDTWPNNNAGCT